MSRVMREALQRRKLSILDAEQLDRSDGSSSEVHGWSITRNRRGRIEIKWVVPSEALLALRGLTALRGVLDRWERELVMVARQQGLDWESIGWGLGVTRQSAHARHRSVDLVRSEMPPDSL